MASILILFLTSKSENVNDDKIFDDLFKFLVGLKTTFESEMVLSATNKIDEQLKYNIDQVISKNESLIGKKVIINGPAGSGHGYIIRNNIIDVLTPPKRIGLVVSDDEKLYSKTIVEVDGEIKLCKYLEGIQDLSSGKWKKLKIFIFHKNTKCFYLLEAESYKLIEGYKLQEVITYNLFCSEFVISILKILNAIEEDCGIDFIVERKKDKEMIESTILRKNKTVNISGNSHIKERMENDYGNMIIFFVCEESRNNFKVILCDDLFSSIDIIEISNIPSILEEFRPISISLCFAGSFATNLIQQEIRSKKETLWKSIKYYYHCNFNEFDWNELMEITVYFLSVETALFIAKIQDNEYVYNYFYINEDQICLLKFKLYNLKHNKNIDKIMFKSYSNDYKLNPDLCIIIEELDINYTTEEKATTIKNVYKNSLFFVGRYISITLKFFEEILAFNSAQNIHVFADDIMAWICLISGNQSLALKQETKAKMKTFLITLDANQLLCYDETKDGLIPDFDLDFSVSNLKKVYRCSKKVFDYLLPFYEYSNYLKHSYDKICKEFNSFKEFKEFIINDLKRVKEVVHNDSDIEKITVKLAECVTDITKSMPLESIECGNIADGEVIEIEVEMKDLFKTIEIFINKAIGMKVPKDQIFVLINYNYKNLEIQKQLYKTCRIFNQNSSIYELYEKYAKEIKYKKFQRKPYAEMLLDELNEKFKEFCQIFDICSFYAAVYGDSIKNSNLFEYKYVICVYPEGCFILNSNQSIVIDSYFTMSRATVNLIVISAKEVLYEKALEYPFYKTYFSRLNTFKNWGYENSTKFAEAGFFSSTEDRGRAICFCCGRVLRIVNVDEPFTEHARLYPNCNFLENVKGQNFISKVTEEYKGCKVFEVS